MALGGFDFLAAEKDTAKKIEELAQVLERVATIFLNGVGSLEKQMDDLRNRLATLETQVDTVLRMGGPKGAPTAAPTVKSMEATADAPPPATGMPPSPAGPSSPPGLAAPPPQTPTSPMGAAAAGGIGIRAQMQGELQSFLARRRAALESQMENEQ